jgi:uncharacterized protein with GYD domain
VQKMVESLGGRLEAFFFTFGENDVLAILDLPENLTAAGISSLPRTEKRVGKVRSLATTRRRPMFL